jgi:hypothetical protein
MDMRTETRTALTTPRKDGETVRFVIERVLLWRRDTLAGRLARVDDRIRAAVADEARLRDALVLSGRFGVLAYGTLGAYVASAESQEELHGMRAYETQLIEVSLRVAELVSNGEAAVSEVFALVDDLLEDGRLVLGAIGEPPNDAA